MSGPAVARGRPNRPANQLPTAATSPFGDKSTILPISFTIQLFISLKSHLFLSLT
jgi:hypothetical protein